ncbi:MAG: hypothetical protein IPJ45_07635 [Ignavibacteria bacterium]|nr:hypothetical protein [Ignavibacteria bacterium]
MKSNKFLLVLLFTIFLAYHFISCGFRTINTPDIEKNYNWKLTFEDNFDGYDNSKWSNNYERGNRTIWSNKELR